MARHGDDARRSNHNGPVHHRLREFAVERLITLYDAWSKPDKAAEWRSKLPQPDEVEETSPETERESDADKDN